MAEFTTNISFKVSALIAAYRALETARRRLNFCEYQDVAETIDSAISMIEHSISEDDSYILREAIPTPRI